jgi:Fic family protein
MGKEKIHYKAPPPEIVSREMRQFLAWFNSRENLDSVLKAAVAHFRFVIIHPFDDGNGRIARALSDMLLARSEGTAERYYSLSSQISAERKRYYAVLQEVQTSRGDITAWLDWFLGCLSRALLAAENRLADTLLKTEFWRRHEETPFNARERLMLNKLLDGFEGKLTSSKWAKMTKCSPDTALRDIRSLLARGILKQEEAGGRSTHYTLRPLA